MSARMTRVDVCKALRRMIHQIPAGRDLEGVMTTLFLVEQIILSHQENRLIQLILDVSPGLVAEIREELWNQEPGLFN